MSKFLKRLRPSNSGEKEGSNEQWAARFQNRIHNSFRDLECYAVGGGPSATESSSMQGGQTSGLGSIGGLQGAGSGDSSNALGLSSGVAGSDWHRSASSAGLGSSVLLRQQSLQLDPEKDNVEQHQQQQARWASCGARICLNEETLLKNFVDCLDVASDGRNIDVVPAGGGGHGGSLLNPSFSFARSASMLNRGSALHSPPSSPGGGNKATQAKSASSVKPNQIVSAVSIQPPPNTSAKDYPSEPVGFAVLTSDFKVRVRLYEPSAQLRVGCTSSGSGGGSGGVANSSMTHASSNANPHHSNQETFLSTAALSNRNTSYGGYKMGTTPRSEGGSANGTLTRPSSMASMAQLDTGSFAGLMPGMLPTTSTAYHHTHHSSSDNVAGVGSAASSTHNNNPSLPPSSALYSELLQDAMASTQYTPALEFDIALPLWLQGGGKSDHPQQRSGATSPAAQGATPNPSQSASAIRMTYCGLGLLVFWCRGGQGVAYCDLRECARGEAPLAHTAVSSAAALGTGTTGAVGTHTVKVPIQPREQNARNAASRYHHQQQHQPQRTDTFAIRKEMIIESVSVNYTPKGDVHLSVLSTDCRDAAIITFTRTPPPPPAGHATSIRTTNTKSSTACLSPVQQAQQTGRPQSPNPQQQQGQPGVSVPASLDSPPPGNFRASWNSTLGMTPGGISNGAGVGVGGSSSDVAVTGWLNGHATMTTHGDPSFFGAGHGGTLAAAAGLAALQKPTIHVGYFPRLAAAQGGDRQYATTGSTSASGNTASSIIGGSAMHIAAHNDTMHVFPTPLIDAKHYVMRFKLTPHDEQLWNQFGNTSDSKPPPLVAGESKEFFTPDRVTSLQPIGRGQFLLVGTCDGHVGVIDTLLGDSEYNSVDSGASQSSQVSASGTSSRQTSTNLFGIGSKKAAASPTKGSAPDDGKRSSSPRLQMEVTPAFDRHIKVFDKPTPVVRLEQSVHENYVLAVGPNTASLVCINVKSMESAWKSSLTTTPTSTNATETLAVVSKRVAPNTHHQLLTLPRDVCGPIAHNFVLMSTPETAPSSANAKESLGATSGVTLYPLLKWKAVTAQATAGQKQRQLAWMGSATASFSQQQHVPSSDGPPSASVSPELRPRASPPLPPTAPLDTPPSPTHLSPPMVVGSPVGGGSSAAASGSSSGGGLFSKMKRIITRRTSAAQRDGDGSHQAAATSGHADAHQGLVNNHSLVSMDTVKSTPSTAATPLGASSTTSALHFPSGNASINMKHEIDQFHATVSETPLTSFCTGYARSFGPDTRIRALPLDPRLRGMLVYFSGQSMHSGSGQNTPAAGVGSPTTSALPTPSTAFAPSIAAAAAGLTMPSGHHAGPTLYLLKDSVLHQHLKLVSNCVAVGVNNGGSSGNGGSGGNGGGGVDTADGWRAAT